MRTAIVSRGALCLAGLLVLGPISVRSADRENNLERQFTAAPGGHLAIEADRGSIAVGTAPGDTVSVRVLRKVTGASEKRAAEIFAHHEVTFTQEANRVRVQAKYTGPTSGWNRSLSGFNVRYEVSVPAKFNLDLKTAGGAITVASLEGEVRAHTAGGSIKTGRIDGPVQVHTAGGSLEIEGATGPIEAVTSGGHIRVANAGSTLSARTSGGSIRIGKARGLVKARTSAGSIEIEQAASAVEATTSAGSIRVGLTGSPEGDCILETSAGDISLRLPEQASARLDAKTSAGSVRSDLALTAGAESKRDRLVGTLGTGGHLVKLRTSAGSIRLSRP